MADQALVTGDTTTDTLTEEVPVLTFGAPLPGLVEQTRFALVPLAENGTLFSLRSVADPGLRLLLAPSWICAPESYSVNLDDEICAELGIADPDTAAVFLVVTPGTSLADSTVNMLAPVVINADTGKAAQVVLTGSEYEIKAPLVAA